MSAAKLAHGSPGCRRFRKQDSAEQSAKGSIRKKGEETGSHLGTPAFRSSN
jgi:hypothetical protein